MGMKTMMKEIEEEEIEEPIMISMTRNCESSLVWREINERLSMKKAREICSSELSQDFRRERFSTIELLFFEPSFCFCYL